MTKLNLTYRSGGCRGFLPKQYPGTVPIIYSASAKYVPNRGVIFVTLLGDNFRNYSIVTIGSNIIPVLFLGSQALLLYLSTNYPPGNYPVQVFNDQYSSNIVNIVL
jgi:hypothetical protein